MLPFSSNRLEGKNRRRPTALSPAKRPRRGSAQHPEIARGSCSVARAMAHPFSLILAGQARSNFPHASPVSCSELFGGSGTPPPSEAYILQPAGFASSQAAPGFLHAFQEPRIVL